MGEIMMKNRPEGDALLLRLAEFLKTNPEKLDQTTWHNGDRHSFLGWVEVFYYGDRFAAFLNARTSDGKLDCGVRNTSFTDSIYAIDVHYSAGLWLMGKTRTLPELLLFCREHVAGRRTIRGHICGEDVELTPEFAAVLAAELPLPKVALEPINLEPLGLRGNDLLRWVMNQILSRPEQWNQRMWHCGTGHCFAGWADIAINGSERISRHEQRVWGECLLTPRDEIGRALGLSYHEAEWLFAGNNTLLDLYVFCRLKLAGVAPLEKGSPLYPQLRENLPAFEAGTFKFTPL